MVATAHGADGVRRGDPFLGHGPWERRRGSHVHLPRHPHAATLRGRMLARPSATVQETRGVAGGGRQGSSTLTLPAAPANGPTGWARTPAPQRRRARPHGGRGKGQGDDGGKGDLGGCGKLLAGLGQEGGGGARRLPVVMVTMKGATGKGSPPQKNGRPAPPPGYRCSPGGAAAALCARCRRRGGTGWPPWQPGDPKKPPHERNGGSVGKRPSPLRRGR